MTSGAGFTIFVLSIYVLSVMRVTRLINYDTILDPVRLSVERHSRDSDVSVAAQTRWSTLSEFLGCPWCVGMWVSLLGATGPVIVLRLSWWWLLPVALSASMLVGLLSPLSADEFDIEDHEAGT